MYDVRITWQNGGTEGLKVQSYRSFDSGLIELVDVKGDIAYLSPHAYAIVALTDSELGENSEV